ncbi:MAG: UDP-N-acetylglucosamine 2-epimerase (non-hydrolyzing) [Parvularculaceae bacterium]|nr:UDP-N-acetylglucosamine 2-epimerase (non-hydrolyzing) [Parvularculaceae bacterium]
MTVRLISVVGARPQFIKAAAVSRRFAASGSVAEKLLHTGQHYDDNMSKTFFDELAIPEPAFRLQIGGSGHGRMTGRMLEQIEEVFLAEKPDAVLVYGDTNSTLAGALAAAKLHIPLVHVEAGLRSFNKAMPEEVNRVLTDHVSDFLFCPTSAAVENLRKENITRGVHKVGDVMYDATLHAKKESAARSRIVETLGLSGRPFVLATVHRAENTDDPARLREIFAFIDRERGDRAVVFPVHPRTRGVMAREGLAPGGARLIDPVGYFDVHALLAACDQVFTDSGGLQKEAYFHGKPCVTLREETEWVETVDAGWNRLWKGPDYAPRRRIDEYGEGDAAGAVLDVIAKGFRAG